MSHKHANKEGGKGVHTQQSNQGDSLDYQQGEKSKNIKPNKQIGEDNQKRAGGNPKPTQPTATDTQSIGSSPKPTVAKPQETPIDTQTTVTSPQPTAAKSQQTAADTQTTVVSPQPTAAKSKQTAADTQTTVVNPKPIGGNLQQIGDNPQHKDLSETQSKDTGEEGQITMKHNNSLPKDNTTHRREASSHHGQENRENRQPGIPEKTKARQPVRNDKKERTYGIPKQASSRSEFSDDEQYDMAEANMIEKSRSRTDMDWTNQLWILKINAFTVIFCVLFTIVFSQWGQVQPVYTIDNSHETKQLMAMEKVIRDLENVNEKHKTMLDDISSKLMALDRRVDNLNETFCELGKSVKSVKTMTESNTGTLEEMRRKKDNYSDKLEQVKTDISAITINLEEKSRQQEKNAKTIQEINKDVSKIRLEMDDQKKKTEGEMSNMSETIKEAEKAKKELQNEMKETYGQVAFLKANAFNKSVFLNLIVFLTIAVFALIIGMWIIWNRVSFDHHGNTPRHGSGTNPRMPVIEQVPNHPPLTNTICVISYGQTNESFNHTLVYKLMRQLSQPLQDTPVRGHLINTHANIANIPHCKLIFMCVEFSTRHVIIEEPGIGQGDIRRTTYDAVKKLGATLVILYTKDHESRQLGDKLRYQKDIYCVASQPELKVLDDQKCFYSVFNSFTQSQVESLETVIRKALQ